LNEFRVSVDGKDRATEPFGVVESPERKFTLKYVAGGALRSDKIE